MATGTIVESASFMTPVAAAGIKLMAATANYQNGLRTYESRIAQEETKAQASAIDNQVTATKEAGAAQANTYYAQAGSSFASAAMDGLQAGGGWARNRGLQAKTDALSGQVDEHQTLLDAVDKELAQPGRMADGEAGTLDASAKASSLAVRDRLAGQCKFGDAAAETEQMNALPRGDLVSLREKVQERIDVKKKEISGYQSTMQTNMQQAGTIAGACKEIASAVSSKYQASYAIEKAQQEALSTQWGYVLDLTKNTFQSARQAMGDCNNQTEKSIDGVTNALKHVVGG